MAQDRGLIIRHAERHEIALPCEIQVAAAHQSVVRLTHKVTQSNGRVRATLVDASAGGLGALSEVFFPRNSLIQLRVLHPVDAEAPPLLDATMRVKRVVMTDRRPAYLLGLSFESHDEKLAQRVQSLLATLEGADA